MTPDLEAELRALLRQALFEFHGEKSGYPMGGAVDPTIDMYLAKLRSILAKHKETK